MTTTPLSTPAATVTPVDPVKGTPEYDAAMAAKFDQNQSPETPEAEATPETPERPAWLPEKFATPEDMAKAYGELETKLSAPKPVETPAGETPAGEDAAKAVVAEAGLDFAALTTEFTEKGAISDESYEALAKAGITRDIVDGYVAGQQALAAQITNEVFTVAGGQENYTAMVAWAGDNLPADDVDAFNKAIDSGNISSMKLAVSGLKAAFTAANGSEPSLLATTTTPSSNTTFTDQSQVTAAMRDPRYKTSESYRQEVQAKIARSSY